MFINIQKADVLSFVLLFGFTCAFLSSKGQIVNGSAKSVTQESIGVLTVGQKVPEEFWTYKHKFYSNGDTLIRTLEHLRGNPIVFDFWASWCSPCINSLKETSSFIDRLTEKGSFIAVTFENSTIADRIWKQHGLHLPGIIEDKLLKQYFPHASVPQVIWIDAEGIVRNQTSQQPINQDNLNMFFAGKPLNLQAKPVFDKNRPILLGTEADKNALQYYQLVLKGYQDYLPVVKFSRNFHKGYFSISFVNLPLITIYRDLAPKLFSAIGEPFFDENFQIRTTDSVGLNIAYTMDLIAPTSDQLSLNTTMLELLNKASGYQARMQKERRECLVMKCIGQISVSKASTKRYKSIDWNKKIQLENVRFAYVLGILSDQRLGGKFIVNETGYKGKIDLNISVTDNLEMLNAQLAKSGLKLESAVREINVFVIKKEGTN
ncbi:TlpA family protein disulfide reductase [Sphingobacterium yanglingense]|uniref:Thiol-disulfide isomerase/thioredoxin n=1 Tax=Sphingobacterium yanglingense TaxID=1437280 RepID=A0A4R6WGK2_9SPHI|nr:TlpA disulfide reductase family protein [Sphingobacterium yanglingense]TDQ79290.1 thiol-disulfide isomerase/thioredoxin [Sphingobacterium yanglingense]